MASKAKPPAGRSAVPRAPARIHIGVGGWNFPPWRGTFYPPDLTQARELEYAASRLSSIEINSTFYGPQKPATFEKWRMQTPRGFMFSVKGPRFATNRRVLAEAGDSIRRFLGGGVMQLGDRLGPINWQLAPTKKFDAEDMDAFMRLLPERFEGRVLRHAIEVRHASFSNDEFITLARQHGIAIVQAADSKYPCIEDASSSFVYARVMGSSPKPKLGYAPRELDRWSRRVQDWASEGREVFLYFISGHKVKNPAAAMALISRLAKPGSS